MHPQAYQCLMFKRRIRGKGRIKWLTRGIFILLFNCTLWTNKSNWGVRGRRTDHKSFLLLLCPKGRWILLVREQCQCAVSPWGVYGFTREELLCTPEKMLRNDILYWCQIFNDSIDFHLKFTSSTTFVFANKNKKLYALSTNNYYTYQQLTWWWYIYIFNIIYVVKRNV